MKKALVLLLVGAVAVLIFTGCGGDTSTSNTVQSVTEEDASMNVTDYVSAEPEVDMSIAESENTTLELLDGEFIEDYDGYPAIKVHYLFTNNSDIPKSMLGVFTIGGFQDSICDEVTPDDEWERQMTDIEPGESEEYFIYYRYDTSTGVPLHIDVYTQESTLTLAEKDYMP